MRHPLAAPSQRVVRCLVSLILLTFSVPALAQESQPPAIRDAIARAFQLNAGDVLPAKAGRHEHESPEATSLGIVHGSFRVQPEARDSNSPHRFFDRTNVTLTVVEIGAMLADGATTQHGLKKYPGSREGNPLARPFVNAGWPGMIAGGAMVVSGEVGLRYLLHRKGHHRWERWIPVFIIADSTIEAIHNAAVLSRASSEAR